MSDGLPPYKEFVIELLGTFFSFFRELLKFSGIFIRAFYLSGLRQSCKFPVPSSTQFDGPARLTGTGCLILGERCRLGRNVLFETNGNAKINIGNRVRINDGTIITSHESVSIGDDTMIGEYVSIRDANHGTALEELIRSQEHCSQAIQIGRDVWIGRGCCILKGVKIGDGAVIGANSVITCNIPKNVIFAGVPGKKIRDRV